MHDPSDPLEQLAPSARRAPRKTRIAVGAAVVCFVLAVAVAALLSATGGGDLGVLGAGDGAGVPASAGGVDPAGSESGSGSGSGSPARGGVTVLVHVLGAVSRPGLVELAEGARVVDAVAAAGGLTAEADASGVNLARLVTDGEQLVVPVVGQAPPAGQAGAPAGETDGGGAAAPGGASTGLVRLNSAGLAELDTLPRIGPALAQRILDWREANGPFTSVEQLREVAGIGDATFAGLVDLVTL
jgi:competence protein ComEA